MGSSLFFVVVLLISTTIQPVSPVCVIPLELCPCLAILWVVAVLLTMAIPSASVRRMWRDTHATSASQDSMAYAESMMKAA